ncbi:MAG: rhomboid family intramembrane serine protease [Lentisphaerae bacterium]|nr:rhomboid family intramembrane serine protease [Lentisphaerota bacterium]
MFVRQYGLQTEFVVTRVVKAFLIAFACVFAVQLIVDHRAGMIFTRVFGLSMDGLRSGYFWQVFTYMFLHGSILHLCFNAIVLYVFGVRMEKVLGPERFMFLYLVSGLVAGLGWLAISGWSYGLCIGASGAVYGVIGTFAAMFPREQLILFPFPIVVSVRTMAIAVIVFSLVSLFAGLNDVAHAAHMSGAVVGYLYGRRLKRPAERLDGLGRWANISSIARNLQSGLRRRKIRLVEDEPVEPPSREEVDRILDKIVSIGINNLTEDEKQTLNRAGGKRGA